MIFKVGLLSKIEGKSKTLSFSINGAEAPDEFQKIQAKGLTELSLGHSPQVFIESLKPAG